MSRHTMSTATGSTSTHLSHFGSNDASIIINRDNSEDVAPLGPYTPLKALKSSDDVSKGKIATEREDRVDVADGNNGHEEVVVNSHDNKEGQSTLTTSAIFPDSTRQRVPSLLLEGMQMLVTGFSSNRSSREWQYRSSSRSSSSGRLSNRSGVVQRWFPPSRRSSTDSHRSASQHHSRNSSRSRSSDGSMDGWQVLPVSASDKSQLIPSSASASFSMTPSNNTGAGNHGHFVHTLQPIMSMNMIPDEMRRGEDEEDDEEDDKRDNSIISSLPKTKPRPSSSNPLANAAYILMGRSQSSSDKNPQQIPLPQGSFEAATSTVSGTTSRGSGKTPSGSSKLGIFGALPVLFNPNFATNQSKIAPLDAEELPVKIAEYETTGKVEVSAASTAPGASGGPFATPRSNRHSHGGTTASGGGKLRRSFAGNLFGSILETFSSPTEQQIASVEGLIAKEESIAANLDQIDRGSHVIHLRHVLHFDAEAGDIVAETAVEVDQELALTNQVTSVSCTVPGALTSNDPQLVEEGILGPQQNHATTNLTQNGEVTSTVSGSGGDGGDAGGIDMMSEAKHVVEELESLQNGSHRVSLRTITHQHHHHSYQYHRQALSHSLYPQGSPSASRHNSTPSSRPSTGSGAPPPATVVTATLPVVAVSETRIGSSGSASSSVARPSSAQSTYWPFHMPTATSAEPPAVTSASASGESHAAETQIISSAV